jgi:hypothetical protein
MKNITFRVNFGVINKIGHKERGGAERKVKIIAGK